jgi:type VI secretion system protein ImpG
LFHRGLEHSIAFVHADGGQPDLSQLNNEVITASLVCTNRMLPALLHSGDISVAVNKNPAVASFSNVTRPTRPLWPVTDGGMHWSLISSMNLNYLSLLDREALIQVMRTFDLPGLIIRSRLAFPARSWTQLKNSTLVRLTACLKVFRFGGLPPRCG